MPAGKMVLAARGYGTGYRVYGRRGQRYGKMITPYRGVTRRRAPLYKNVEFKSFDVTGALSMVLDTTGQVDVLNTMVQGNDINNRIGRQVNIRSIEMRAVAQATAATGTRQECLTMLVWDKDPDGVSATIASILNSANVNSARNLTNRDRFIVLKRWNYVIYPDTIVNNSHTLKYYKRHNLKTTYNAGNAGTIADIQKGALLMVTLGQNVAGVTAGAMTYQCRIRYLDD